MKYIRTKDGIGKTTHEDNKNYRAKFGRKCPLISKEEVINQADTIEELCDEFVVIDDLDRGINTLWRSKVFSLQEVRKMVKHNEIYGAIWTDKGLKYVAKMNEKGELELL